MIVFRLFVINVPCSLFVVATVDINYSELYFLLYSGCTVFFRQLYAPLLLILAELSVYLLK
jgi:hypothetical protein